MSDGCHSAQISIAASKIGHATCKLFSGVVCAIPIVGCFLNEIHNFIIDAFSSTSNFVILDIYIFGLLMKFYSLKSSNTFAKAQLFRI